MTCAMPIPCKLHPKEFTSKSGSSWASKLNLEGKITEVNAKEIEEIIMSALSEQRIDTLEEIEKWAWDNGITDKKSFKALINFIHLLKNRNV